mgnify:CR=1 FL=1|jgi:phosphorylcholine metabolism protein LicD
MIISCSIDDVHDVILKLSDAFIDVCNKHHLNWFPDGGTLLGAVREHGIISWDDDADFAMPRQDYNMLLQLAYDHKIFNEGKILFQTPRTDKNFFHIHARLRMLGTTAICQSDFNKDYCKGIFIDIYPIDAISDDMRERLYEIGFVKTVCKTEDSTAFDALNESLTFLSDENISSKSCAMAVFFRYTPFMMHSFLKSAYASYSLQKFNGLKHMMRIPSGYASILETWYGNDWNVPKKGLQSHDALVNAKKDYHEYDSLTFEELTDMIYK